MIRRTRQLLRHLSGILKDETAAAAGPSRVAGLALGRETETAAVATGAARDLAVGTAAAVAGDVAGVGSVTVEETGPETAATAKRIA